MTRRQAAARPVAARPAPVRVGGRLPLPGSLIAPALSMAGLLVIGLLTVSLFTGKLPLPGGNSNGGGAGDNGPDPNATVAPSGVVITATPKPGPQASEAPKVLGSIVFAKQGNIWVESDYKARQVTTTGQDSMPSWSPDGQWIYFIETVSQRGLFPSQGSARYYTLTYPILTRVHPDGTGRQNLLSGLYKAGGGSYQWFYWIREPVVSPDGRTVALMSDGPDPTRSDVVLQFFDIASGKLTRAPIGEILGHQNAAWRPDGKQVIYVRNNRDGARGAPAIWVYDPATKRTSALTGPGYTNPVFSPDGRYLAATKTSSLGTDVVILNAKTGSEVLRLTTDGQSWAPAWSPAGDSIAYLHIAYQIVDLKLTPLTGRAGSWTLGDPLSLTQYSGLDGASRPGWFVPAGQLPTPTAAPSASNATSSNPSGGAPVASPSKKPAASSTP